MEKTIEELKQQRALYADLANAMPAGVYRIRVFGESSVNGDKWSSSTDVPYAVEFANDRFLEILKLDRATYENDPGVLIELIFADDKAEFVRQNVESNKFRIPFIWEGRFVISGKISWIHFESYPRILDDGDILWTGILYDISERKDAELKIAYQNQELQILNAEKDKFLSIIAHDLKSPFNAVIGFSELLAGRIKAKDYENVEEYATYIQKLSNKAMDLLKNLMQWALSHTGRIEFNPEKLEIGTFIDETTFLYNDIARQKSITIRKDLSEFLEIFADRAMLFTVFRNLISNAIKYSMPGAELSVSAIEQQDNILFSVKDTGIGISKSRVEGLFLINHMSSTIGTSNEEGTGLGLILCKEFIEKHGGKIWVESQENVGSTFYFTLPKSHISSDD